MNLADKKIKFEKALETFIERSKKDNFILAIVLIGSLNEQTIWHKEGIRVWIIVGDSVVKRRKSDGNEERIFRTFVEDDINFHAEIIERSRFKRMIEGSSRTAFTHNFFAIRKLVYTNDESIKVWFADANKLAMADQETSLFIASTWVMASLPYIEKWIYIKEDLEIAQQHIIGTAYSLAAMEIIMRGEIYEEEIIYKAQEYNPKLFTVVYTNLLLSHDKTKLEEAYKTIDEYIFNNWEQYLKPVVKYLKKRQGLVSLSEMGDEFAHTQIYPWHIETTCEWMHKKSLVEKLSLPIKLATKSRYEMEEPAYQFEGM